jgi:type VI secretion system protein ImpA
MAGAATTGVAGAVSAVAARAVTREDMLKELGRIADYFRRTEPHSPLAYTLEEAVRRGRLTWPELLEEVVPDSGVRGAILVMLGIRPPTPTV